MFARQFSANLLSRPHWEQVFPNAGHLYFSHTCFLPAFCYLCFLRFVLSLAVSWFSCPVSLQRLHLLNNKFPLAFPIRAAGMTGDLSSPHRPVRLLARSQSSTLQISLACVFPSCFRSYSLPFPWYIDPHHFPQYVFAISPHHMPVPDQRFHLYFLEMNSSVSGTLDELCIM